MRQTYEVCRIVVYAKGPVISGNAVQAGGSPYVGAKDGRRYAMFRCANANRCRMPERFRRSDRSARAGRSTGPNVVPRL